MISYVLKLPKYQGLCTGCHHSGILSALNIPKVKDRIGKQTMSLYYHIYQVDTPSWDLCLQLLSMYLSSGKLIPGTLVDRVVQLDYFPVLCAFNKCIPVQTSVE